MQFNFTERDYALLDAWCNGGAQLVDLCEDNNIKLPQVAEWYASPHIQQFLTLLRTMMDERAHLLETESRVLAHARLRTIFQSANNPETARRAATTLLLLHRPARAKPQPPATPSDAPPPTSPPDAPAKPGTLLSHRPARKDHDEAHREPPDRTPPLPLRGVGPAARLQSSAGGAPPPLERGGDRGEVRADRLGWQRPTEQGGTQRRPLTPTPAPAPAPAHTCTTTTALPLGAEGFSPRTGT
ncbi:MAG TPA: hypothetical protein VHN77_00810, partial [Phycisphaerales bacterium]|nr:hypothetical protein [Phycisphaerales bacterium]